VTHGESCSIAYEIDAPVLLLPSYSDDGMYAASASLQGKLPNGCMYSLPIYQINPRFM